MIPSLINTYLAHYLHKVINHVLQSALDEEFSPGERWGSDWLLIEQRYHQDFSVPTMPLVQPFKSGFLNASIDHLQNFVTIELNGRAGAMAELPTAFGIIDERTALDNTISFWVQDHVSPMQEAQIRTMWGGETALDRMLANYIDDSEYISHEQNATANMTKEESRTHLHTRQDTELNRSALQFYKLAGSTRVLEGASQARECLDDSIQSQELNQTTKWFEFRLHASCAMGHICLINDYGPVEIMTNRVFKSDMFDANRVGRAFDF
ncbi:hypothetical protein QM012_008036 [Aureobasidium pullulans]|uniref:Uncharacterized protein n=1 Tax=Aureobasidium pullulans TaxID=5580 RepID=A0ABR0TM73_AURPU